MRVLRIRGGRRLSGSVRAQGAKNAALPVLAASLLAEGGECRIADVAPLEDVNMMIGLLESVGADIRRDSDGVYVVRADGVTATEPAAALARRLRASFLVAGPLLARFGAVRLPFPGGCPIGLRPIDQHLKGFAAMGAEITTDRDTVAVRVRGRLRGARIYLDVPSVGATENVMMAATLAHGTTIIENAAREPEIVDLARFLNAMGADVRGAGTGTLRIRGADALTSPSIRHAVIPDRIEAGTYLVAAAIAGGRVRVDNAVADHLCPLVSKLREMGAEIAERDAAVEIAVFSRLKAVDVKTLPHPGFPTDLQAPMTALLAVCRGTAVVTETVFENRFGHVDGLRRMRASIRVEGRKAYVTGMDRLHGTRVRATDLRAAAALVLAALAAEGESEIEGLPHLDRGYWAMEEKLASLGADVRRTGDADAEESVADEDVLPKVRIS